MSRLRATLRKGLIFGCVILYFRFHWVHFFRLPSVHPEHMVSMLPQFALKEIPHQINVSQINLRNPQRNVTQQYTISKEITNPQTNITKTTAPSQPDLRQTKILSKASKTNSKPKFLRFDFAAPDIRYASTHFLGSLPETQRFSNLQAEYMRDSKHRSKSKGKKEFFSKPHLHEINPSIVRLPERYKTNPFWKKALGGDLSYVVSYRVTHETKCFDGDEGQPKRTPQTDYLGIAVLSSDLRIVLDTTVDLKNYYIEGRNMYRFYYNDYRLFLLYGELYLSTTRFVLPLRLELCTFGSSSSNNNNTGGNGTEISMHCGKDDRPDNHLEVPPAFGDYHTTKITNSNSLVGLKISVRNYASCCVGAGDWGEANKNLLYFEAAGKNNVTKALFYPRHNPHDVRDVDLRKRCSLAQRRKSEQEQFKEARGFQPEPSFHTIESMLYPNKTHDSFWLADRGSACCTSLKRSSISVPKAAYEQNYTSHFSYNQSDIRDDETLLVAIVHPKTHFPGKKLPRGVVPNTYLSRFIAFLPHPPYTIVARSGSFCLGYPDNGLDKISSKHNESSPLVYTKMERMVWGEMAFSQDCPRIHFVTGMTDADNHENESIIISYGVSDCLSRLVEISKSEIIRMLSPII